jgi:hypothetical protein
MDSAWFWLFDQGEVVVAVVVTGLGSVIAVGYFFGRLSREVEDGFEHNSKEHGMIRDAQKEAASSLRRHDETVVQHAERISKVEAAVDILRSVK